MEVAGPPLGRAREGSFWSWVAYLSKSQLLPPTADLGTLALLSQSLEDSQAHFPLSWDEPLPSPKMCPLDPQGLDG